jgi:hypothetical protein
MSGDLIPECAAIVGAVLAGVIVEKTELATA